jgi:hypothetical protein
MAEELGEFAAGEVPPVLTVNFVDNSVDKNPVPLAGFSAFIEIEKFPEGTTELGQGSLNITDESGGVVEYLWAEADMQEVGDYSVLVWVHDGGTQRYATDLLTYEVYDGPGPTPTW